MKNKIEKIQILGSDCSRCEKLFSLVKQAAEELNLGIEVEYIKDVQKIIELGVMSSPVLAINGEAVLVGQVPDLEKLKKILQGESKATDEEEHGACACCC